MLNAIPVRNLSCIIERLRKFSFNDDDVRVEVYLLVSKYLFIYLFIKI